MEPIKLHTLKYIISKNNTSQREISLKTNIPEGRLSHIITGRLKMKKSEIDKLCQFFDMEYKILFVELYNEEKKGNKPIKEDTVKK